MESGVFVVSSALIHTCLVVYRSIKEGYVREAVV